MASWLYIWSVLQNVTILNYELNFDIPSCQDNSFSFFFLMSHEWNQHFNYSFIIEWGFQDILSFSNNFRFYNQKKMASKGFNSKVTIHANTPCSFVSSGQRSNLIIICNLWYQVALYHIIIFKYIILLHGFFSPRLNSSFFSL